MGSEVTRYISHIEWCGEGPKQVWDPSDEGGDG